MTTQRIMPWIDQLPNVEATTFLARRTEIEKLMDRAGEFTEHADTLVSNAYLESCYLEGDATDHWSREEVEAAKRRVGW